MGKAVQPLTDEQKSLIETYYDKFGEHDIKNCIWKVYKRHLPEAEFDDCMGVAHEAVVKAARNFQSKKGTEFSTFVHMNVISALNTDIRDKNRMKRRCNIEADSLDRQIDNDGEMTLGEIIGVEFYEEEDLSRVAEFLNDFSNKQLRVLIMLLIGGTKSSVMSAMNISSNKFDLLMKEKIVNDKNKKLFCIRR